MDFKYLVEKIEAGGRFTFDEGCEMFRNLSLPMIKALADFAREKKTGNFVYYIVNRHVYYSNVCAWKCRFCAFSKNAGDARAYTKTPEQILREIDDTPFISEVRITGGVNPKLDADYFCTMFSMIRQKYPHIHIEALAPTEIDFFSAREEISPLELLTRLKSAGLGSLAAGGAEVASSRVRDIICPNKSPFSKWLDISKLAHNLGIKSNASILYGHIETIEERVEHLLKIRELQDQTGGFNSFIPLKYIEHKAGGVNTSIIDKSEDLRMFAISRLLLDNFRYIKALWLYNGPELTRAALSFGANDIGGTVYELQKGVARSAGSGTRNSFSREDMINLILSAKKIPYERGVLYERKRNVSCQ